MNIGIAVLTLSVNPVFAQEFPQELSDRFATFREFFRWRSNSQSSFSQRQDSRS